MMDKAYVGLGSNLHTQGTKAPSQQHQPKAHIGLGSDRPVSGKKILSMERNERMAGSVPVWKTPSTAKQNIEQNLGLAQAGGQDFDQALAYASQSATSDPAEEFGFGDLVDMVNPLHHIPLVNMAYREITGDEIKPIGKIIGGGVFGGAAGAAVGLVDAAVTAETGKDMAGNAMGFVVNGEMPQFKNHRASSLQNPEDRLNDAIKSVNDPELPANLLAFSSTSRPSNITIERKIGVSIERVSPSEQNFGSRQVDTDQIRPQIKRVMDHLDSRDPITKVSITRLSNGYDS